MPILLGLLVPVADLGMALAQRQQVQQAGAQSQHLQWAAVIMVGTNRLRRCLSGNYTVARAILTRLEAAIISAMTPVIG